MIIECPPNDLFHDVLTVILTSRMGVSEMVVNVDNVVTIIYGIIHNVSYGEFGDMYECRIKS